MAYNLQKSPGTYLREKIKIKKRIKNAINNIKKSTKKLKAVIYLNI